MCIILKKHKERNLKPRVELRPFLNRVGRNWILKDELARGRLIRTLRAVGRECAKTQRSRVCLLGAMNSHSGFQKYPLLARQDARQVAIKKL